MTEKGFFVQYQKLLLNIANHPLGRAYLGLVDAPVVILSPNSAHYFVGFEKNKPRIIGRFYSSNRYAKRLSFIKQMVDSFEKANSFRVGFGQGLDILLPAILDKMYAGLPMLAATVTQFTSNANVETVSFDGYTGFDYNNTEYSGWAAHRGAASSGSSSVYLSDAGATMGVNLGDPNSNNKFEITRSFILFDTSILTALATINSANWHWQYSSIVIDSEAGSWRSKLYLVTSSPASNTALTAADFDQVQFVDQSTPQTSIAAKAINTDYNFSLNATGLGNINKTGISKFGLVHGNDFENVDPNTSVGQSTRLGIYTSDYTTVPSRVHYLEIDYTPAPSLTGSPLFFRGGAAIG